MKKTVILRFHADQAESNTPAGDLLGATAEMLHRLRVDKLLATEPALVHDINI